MQELDALAEYIALDHPIAARHLVQKIFKKQNGWKIFRNPARRHLNFPSPSTGK